MEVSGGVSALQGLSGCPQLGGVFSQEKGLFPATKAPSKCVITQSTFPRQVPGGSASAEGSVAAPRTGARQEEAAGCCPVGCGGCGSVCPAFPSSKPGVHSFIFLFCFMLANTK